MANYYGTTRSNYFLVKDAEAFKAEMENLPVEVITSKIGNETGYGIMDNDADGGGLSWVTLDEDGEAIDLDWIEVLSKHLRDGQVCVLMETGAEKYRLLNGYAFAFNNKGEERTVRLTNIYDLAAELGDGITKAEY